MLSNHNIHEKDHLVDMWYQTKAINQLNAPKTQAISNCITLNPNHASIFSFLFKKDLFSTKAQSRTYRSKWLLFLKKVKGWVVCYVPNSAACHSSFPEERNHFLTAALFANLACGVPKRKSS